MANAADPDGSRCLHHAAGVAEELLLAGAGVNQTDRLGRSPLAVAVQLGSPRTTDVLMRAGADPLLPDEQGWSQLKIANVKEDDESPDLRATTLCSLAESGNFEELNRLATPENCSRARSDGLTPLMCAARADGRPQGCHVTCAVLLLTLAEGREDRAQMANAADPDGSRCLHHAAAVDNAGVAEKLLLAGAGVNQADRLGRSPLAVAVQLGSPRTTDLLMRAGADPLLPDEQDWSPLKIAKVKEDDSDEMAKRLERWLPSDKIPADFQEVDRKKRTKLNTATRGQFSDIYEVQTKPPNLNVVVRVLTRFNDLVVETEKRGLEALKKMQHANIVQLIRFDDSTDCIEIFLEKIEGKTISELLESRRPFIEVEIQKHFRKLASALCYLHNHPSGPVIHRDINCRNIMLARDGAVKLIDFGVSLPSGTVVSNSIIGTYNFMAPEIIAQDVAQYSRQSDMWAVGCVLFTMTMGEEPYKGTNPVALGKKIEGPVPDIGPPNKVSSGLRDLYHSCMEKDPNMRISATGMLLHEFVNWRLDRDNDLILMDDIQEWSKNGRAAIEILESIVQKINESYKSEVKAKVGTTTAAVAGGVTAIIGFALLIPSFGAALPLVIAGTSVAIAGGVGSATANVVGNIVQGKEFKKSQDKISEFKQSTQTLVGDSVRSICDSVTTHVEENHSAIDLGDSKILIKFLHKEVKEIRETFNKTEVKEIRETFNKTEVKENREILDKTEITKRLSTEQLKQLDEMFGSWISPVDELLERLTDVEERSERRIDRDASNQFNRALQKAIDFVVRTLRIMIFGSVEEPSDYSARVNGVRGGLRSVVGGTQLGVEISSAAGRTVLGRAFGIVGSAVFTAVDIGFLAYYSVRLHRAKDGANAEKADPIACQIDVFKKFVREAEDLNLS